MGDQAPVSIPVPTPALVEDVIHIIKEDQYKVRVLTDPHILQSSIQELLRLSENSLEMPTEKFRKCILEENDFDVGAGSPYLFSQFWDDLNRIFCYAVSLTSEIPVGTFAKVVSQCLNSPKAVQLYWDFPTFPPTSLQQVYRRLQRDWTPGISEEEVKDRFARSTTHEKLRCLQKWHTELQGYSKDLEAFIKRRSDDLSESHKRFCEAHLKKTGIAVRQVQEMMDGMKESCENEIEDEKKAFERFREAAQKVVIASDADAKEEKIREMFFSLSSEMLQIFNQLSS